MLEARCVPASINTWVAPGTAGNWNTAANWSLMHVPNNMEIATFDASSSAACFIDAPMTGTNSISGINITSAYTTFVFSKSDLIVGADGFVQAGGLFAANSFNITVAGDWLQSSPAGFSAGAGNVDFNGVSGTTQSLDSGSSAFNNLVHSGAGLLKLFNNSLTVNAALDNNAGTFDANGLDLRVNGLTSINAGTVQNTGAADTLTFVGGLDMVSAILSTGLGTAVLGGDVTAAPTPFASPTMSTINGNLNLGGNRTFTVNANIFGNELDIGAAISNGGLYKDGPGTLGLGHANFYSGGTFVNAGVLGATVDQALGSGTGAITVANGAVLNLNASNSYSGGTTVQGGEIDIRDNNALGSGPLTLDSGSRVFVSTANLINNAVVLNGIASINVGFMVGTFWDTTWAGPISGTGGFNVNTSFTFGSLRLTGNDTYSGATSISVGNFGVTTLPNSAVTLDRQADLIVESDVSIASLSLNGGRVQWLEPGILSTGIFQVNGPFQAPGALLDFMLNGLVPGTGYSQLRVNGTVNLGAGVATLHDTASMRFAYGTKFQIIDNDGTDAVNGFFVGLPEGAVTTDSAGNRFQITYHGGDGNDVVLTAIARQDLIGRVDSNGQWWLAASNGSGFTSSQPLTWSTGVTWVNVVTGDFNGDGFTDIAGRAKETGDWWVSLANGSGGFTTSKWGTWSTGVTWADVQVGDFNGDGKADIVGRFAEGGQWWASLSNGSSFTNSLWDTWSTGVSWADVKVGDFNGDGKADITGRYLQDGTWWTGISTGSSFTTTMWGTWSTSVNWVDVQVGDFNGDGKADITGRALQTGDWWTNLSTGSNFTMTKWATWSTSVNWVDVKVGDFNDDGIMDIVGRARETGDWWAGISNGSAFTSTKWDTWSTGVTWVDVQVGDFNGDGKADITGRTLETGDWWTGISSGSAFTTTKWATWSTGVTWTGVHAGDVI